MAMATLVCSSIPAVRTTSKATSVTVARAPILGRPTFLPARPVQAFVARKHTSSTTRSRSNTVRVNARDEATLELDEGVEGGADYSGLLAVVGYAAVHFGKVHVDRNLLLKALALYTLVNAAVNLITRRGFGEKISHVIGPASLAVYALNFSRISFLDTVTVLFGYFLAEKLEPTNLFWVFIATLVASVYYGYGTLWYAAAVGVVSLTKLYRANEDKKPLPVLLLAVVAASGWAVYKEQHYLWALILYVAQTLWAALKTGQRVAEHVSD
ncbi:hypothetical protein WJX75_003035 [Coccomyxa subellipsoidea]|uniref:Uncharacterized protein n=1 Tax=Coccomyxa subellipsoidea TaxID=248742 RepID=A0ABR2YC09_9CHLO